MSNARTNRKVVRLRGRQRLADGISRWESNSINSEFDELEAYRTGDTPRESSQESRECSPTGSGSGRGGDGCLALAGSDAPVPARKGKYGSRMRVGATSTGSLPGNRAPAPGNGDGSRLLSLEEELERVQAAEQKIRLEHQMRAEAHRICAESPEEARIEPPRYVNIEEELTSYLQSYVGRSRITLLSLEYARKLAVAWVSKNCPGLNERRRLLVIDRALTALEGPNKADSMTQGRRNQSWWKWPWFRSIRTDDFAATIRDVNRIRSGKRLEGISLRFALGLMCIAVAFVAMPMAICVWTQAVVGLGIWTLVLITFCWLLFRLTEHSSQVIPEK